MQTSGPAPFNIADVRSCGGSRTTEGSVNLEPYRQSGRCMKSMIVVCGSASAWGTFSQPSGPGPWTTFYTSMAVSRWVLSLWRLLRGLSFAIDDSQPEGRYFRTALILSLCADESFAPPRYKYHASTRRDGLHATMIPSMNACAVVMGIHSLTLTLLQSQTTTEYGSVGAPALWKTQVPQNLPGSISWCRAMKLCAPVRFGSDC